MTRTTEVRINPDRFWAKVDMSGGLFACWPWTGQRTRTWGGYGMVSAGWPLRKIKAHRIALQLSLGRPLGVGLCACHHCDNPPCCNPAHLFEGTPADNHRDMVSKGRGPTGTRNPAARLSEADVLAIRRASESVPRRVLADAYGVDRSTISLIVSGRRWAHVR